MLHQLKNWKDFFHRIVDELSENIIYWIKIKRLNTKEPYNLWQGWIFQLIGTVKQMNLKEAIHFKYLANFLQDRENMKFLQTSLTIFYKKVQNVLDKISNVDILSIFMYFNLITLRFENQL